MSYASCVLLCPTHRCRKHSFVAFLDHQVVRLIVASQQPLHEWGMGGSTSLKTPCLTPRPTTRFLPSFVITDIVLSIIGCSEASEADIQLCVLIEEYERKYTFASMRASISPRSSSASTRAAAAQISHRHHIANVVPRNSSMSRRLVSARDSKLVSASHHRSIDSVVLMM